MALAFLSSLFGKKKTKEEPAPSSEPLEVEELEEEVESRQENEQITQILERINEIENDIPRIKISIDTLKKQIQELRDDIDRLDKTIKDVMMLYEVISQEINPFKEQMGQENPLTSEIQEIRKELEDLKLEIAQIKNDIKVLAGYGVDLDSIIYEVLAEV
ncbi:flagella accessory protein C [Thermococcus henrietii]|uniref:flagella accessory protein C n=1 Tax=Thermococcus henrietii TaxID=2016361 RepID=UPI000C068C79|nr:flagella accessory protein C [Thermococcus henrietii]